jgi:hypothetical protein
MITNLRLQENANFSTLATFVLLVSLYELIFGTSQIVCSTDSKSFNKTNEEVGLFYSLESYFFQHML